MENLSTTAPVATPAPSPYDRKLNIGDVVQVLNDKHVPTEIVGTLGYVMDAESTAAITFRVYVPKNVEENAEYAEYTLPRIALYFVGTVSADMQPL